LKIFSINVKKKEMKDKLFIAVFIAIIFNGIEKTQQQQTTKSSCTADFSFKHMGLFTDYEEVAILNKTEEFKVPSEIHFFLSSTLLFL